MHNNRTLEYLQSFSRNDWKSFKRYQADRIREGTDLNKLIKHIFEYQHHLGHKQLTIDNIHKNLFGKKSRKKVLNLFSQFTALIREFLIEDQLGIDKHMKKVLLLQALNKRSLYNEANKLSTLMENEIKEAPLEYFNSLYIQLLNHHQYFSDNPVKYTKKGNRFLQTSIDSISNYHEQLRGLYYLETGNRKMILRKQFEEINDDFRFKENYSDTLSNITYHLFLIRIHHNAQSAEYLNSEMTKNHGLFSNELRLNIYIILRMYYARLANQGDLQMARKIFNLHKLIIENSYFDFEGQVDPKRFIPVVELSIFLGETKWVKIFIEDYQDKLEIVHKVTTLRIAEAFIHFGNKEYEEALSILNQLYPKDLYYKNIILRLSLISYLEIYQDDILFIQQKIDNFKLFYYRNKRFLTKRVYESSNNLVKVIYWILQNRDHSFIKKEMQKMQYIFYRLYIFSKLDKIK